MKIKQRTQAGFLALILLIGIWQAGDVRLQTAAFTEASASYSGTLSSLESVRRDGWRESFSADPQQGTAFTDVPLGTYFDFQDNCLDRRTDVRYNSSFVNQWNKPFRNVAALTYAARSYRYFKLEIDWRLSTNRGVGSPWPLITFGQPNKTPELFQKDPIYSGYDNPQGGENAIGVYTEYEGRITVAGKPVTETKKNPPTEYTGAYSDWRHLTLTVLPDGITVTVGENTLTVPLGQSYLGGYITLMIANTPSAFRNVTITEIDATVAYCYEDALSNAADLEADGWCESFSASPQQENTFNSVPLGTNFSFASGFLNRKTTKNYSSIYHNKSETPFQNVAALTYGAKSVRYFKLELDYRQSSTKNVTAPYPAVTFGQRSTVPAIFYKNPIPDGYESPQGDEDAIGVYARADGTVTVAGKKVTERSGTLETALSGDNTTWRHLCITVIPGCVTVTVDGKMSTHTELADTYNGGYIALMIGNSPSAFKNLSLCALGLYGAKGDVNADGLFNALDVGTLRKILIGTEKNPMSGTADVNYDNQTNILDLVRMKREIVLINWQDESVSRPMPHDTAVRWQSLNGVKATEQQEKQFLLIADDDASGYAFSLTFPQEGGCRLSAKKEGYFKPNGLKALTYRAQNGGVEISAGGETKAIFFDGADGWRLELYHGSNLVNTLSGSDLQLGFEDKNVAKVRYCGAIGTDETFTGFGERFDQVVRNGTSSLLWNLDVLQDINNPAEDAPRERTYTNIPLLHSSNGYSVFFNSSYAIKADVGKAKQNRYSLEAFGPTFDFYFFTGALDERLADYCALTGYNILPPKWAFSYWAGNSAEYWKYANGGDYLKSLQEMMDGYAALGTPIGTMFVEGVIYRDEKVYELLKPTDTKVIAWHDSGYWKAPALSGLSEEEQPYVHPIVSVGSSEIPQKYLDFTNPYVVRFIESNIGGNMRMGLKGAMIDFGDAVPYNSKFHNGMIGDEMHNIYAYFYQKTYKEFYEKYCGNDYVLFGRAGYVGSQSLMAKFLGDCPCTMQGIREALTAAMGLSLCGFSSWGSDMGGLGNVRSSIPNTETYRRWLQWSAFNPLMRSHGHTTRNPWEFGDGAVSDFKRYYWLRENLLNAIYSSAIESSISGTVMAKPMMLAFPNEQALNRVSDEYLFCDNLLVAPVYMAGAASRSVTLPSGKWIDFWTGNVYSGGQTITANAPIDTIPLYLRAGAVLPITLAKDLKLCTNMEGGRVEGLLVTPAAGDRDCRIYSDADTFKQYHTTLSDEKTTIITSENGYTGRVAKIVGVSADSVIVNGKALSARNIAAYDGKAGFCVDETENTTTVILPVSGFRTLEIKSK